MTENRMDAWITKEVELAQRHEELLLRREALLQGTEAYYDAQENRAASFIAGFSQAEQRNRDLLRDLNGCINDLKKDSIDPGTPKFNTLKHNYWMMVRNIYPVWQEEVCEYNRRHQLRNQSPRGHSPRGRSPNTTGSRLNSPISQAGLSPRPPPGTPPHSSRTPRRASPVSSPTTSPMSTATQSMTSPIGSPMGRVSPVNSRPPSPGRKAGKKTPKKGKGENAAKSSKSKNK